MGRVPVRYRFTAREVFERGWGNNSELAETAADQIGEHGLLLDEDFPGAVEHEDDCP